MVFSQQILDTFVNIEFWYIDQGVLAPDVDGPSSFSTSTTGGEMVASCTTSPSMWPKRKLKEVVAAQAWLHKPNIKDYNGHYQHHFSLNGHPWLLFGNLFQRYMIWMIPIYSKFSNIKKANDIMVKFLIQISCRMLE